MFQPYLNPNVTNLKESATLAINLKAKNMKAQNLTVHHFGFGQSPFPVHSSIVSALAKESHQKDYLPTKGLPELCEAISSYYKKLFGYNLNKEMIIIGPGSKEMLFQILYILEGPVFVPAPSWVSYGPQLNLRGKSIEPIQTKRENSYKLQPEELEQACKSLPDKQKILIFNNPSNPTGALYTKEEIQNLAHIARKNNIVIISDEIYSLVNFSEEPYSSFHHFCPERTIITSGLSKSHAAGGYRLGFISFPNEMKDVLQAICAMVSETFSAVSAPIQYAAIEAYNHNNHDLMNYIQICTKIHKLAGEYLHNQFIQMGLNCPKPNGAFYLFPDFENYRSKLEQKHITCAKKLTEHLLSEYSVAVLPGSDFYYPENFLGCRVASVDYDGHFVYSAALKYLNKKKELDKDFLENNCANLRDGCHQIRRFLNSL